jgi:hypothetical protein
VWFGGVVARGGDPVEVDPRSIANRDCRWAVDAEDPQAGIPPKRRALCDRERRILGEPVSRFNQGLDGRYGGSWRAWGCQVKRVGQR